MRYVLLSVLLSFLTVNLQAKPKSAATKKRADTAPASKKVTESSAPGKREEGDFVIEKRSDGSTVKYKKKTSYDFEGSSIEGIYNKPSGAYISNIKDVRGKSVLKIRENFDNEVSDSSRLVK